MICQKVVLFLEAMSVLVSSWLFLKHCGFCNIVYGVTALCGSVAQIAGSVRRSLFSPGSERRCGSGCQVVSSSVLADNGSKRSHNNSIGLPWVTASSFVRAIIVF